MYYHMVKWVAYIREVTGFGIEWKPFTLQLKPHILLVSLVLQKEAELLKTRSKLNQGKLANCFEILPL